MSMHEALRPLRGIVDWLKGSAEEEIKAPVLPTPIEEAHGLVELALRAGMVERQSSTWNAVAKWAADEIIKAQLALEIAEGDRAAALRARCKTLRDLLKMDQREPEPTLEREFDLDPY